MKWTNMFEFANSACWNRMGFLLSRPCRSQTSRSWSYTWRRTGCYNITSCIINEPAAVNYYISSVAILPTNSHRIRWKQSYLSAPESVLPSAHARHVYQSKFESRLDRLSSLDAWTNAWQVQSTAISLFHRWRTSLRITVPISSATVTRSLVSSANAIPAWRC